MAEDIDWYGKENEYIKSQSSNISIHMERREEEIVIVGSQKREDASYHANLQEVFQQEMNEA